MRRVLTVLTSIALVSAMAAPAHADFNIAVGLKWIPANYTTPVGAGTETPANTATTTDTASVPGQYYKATGDSLYGWNTTSLDNYIGFFFTEQIGLQIGLDIGYASHNNSATNAGDFSTSYFQFGFGLGGKFYLNRPTAQRVSPYLFVNFFKYFASVSTNDPAINNDIAGAIGSFHSPIGFELAFGAEYFFTTSFSLGAEVLGLRFAHVEGSLPCADLGATAPVGCTTGTVSTGESYFTLYTGVSLNYRFLATASVRTYEEDEDRQNPRPRRKPPVRRPQPVEPPQDDNNNDQRSPESVD